VQRHRPSQVPPKTYVQQLSLWSGVPKDTSLLRLFLRPFPFIAYPAVAFSFLGYAYVPFHILLLSSQTAH
jgi:hypothetical protein